MLSLRRAAARARAVCRPAPAHPARAPAGDWPPGRHARPHPRRPAGEPGRSRGARRAAARAPHPASPPICHMTTGSHMILIRTGQWFSSTCDVMESMRPQRMKALPFVIYSKFEACYHRVPANAGAAGLASSRTANRNGPMRGHGRAAVFISAKRAGRARGRVLREPRAGRSLCGSMRARRRLPRFWCGHRGDGRSAAEAEAEAEAEAGAPPREGGGEGRVPAHLRGIGRDWDQEEAAEARAAARAPPALPSAGAEAASSPGEPPCSLLA